MAAALFAALVRTSGNHPELLCDTLQSLALQSEPCSHLTIGEGDSIDTALNLCRERFPNVEFLFFLDEGRVIYPFFTSVVKAALLATGADVVDAGDVHVLRAALHGSLPGRREGLRFHSLSTKLSE